jgi:hypothetical protein
MIIEEKLTGFNHKMKFTTLDYPQCECGKCPNFYWNMLAIAARCSGKTYTVCKMIRHWEENKITKNGTKYDLRTILISPTIQANEIYQSLKSLDMENDSYDTYSDDILLDIIADVKQKKKEYEEWLEYVEFYKKFIKIKDNDLEKLYDENPEMFKKLEENDFKHYYDIPHETPKVTLILLDDLLATGAFTTKSKSALTNALIKNRHLGICFAIMAQSLKSIQKNVRLNCNLFFLGKFATKKIILEDIYEEISNVCKPEEFEELYDHATDKQYGALIVDLTHKNKRFLSNFDTELFLDKEKNVNI